MKKALLVWLPTIIGIFLLAISQIDLYLFSSGVLDPKAILGWEIALVFLGVLCSLFVFSYGIYFLFKKRWGSAVSAIINSIFFLILFGIGGALGGAYLSAT